MIYNPKAIVSEAEAERIAEQNEQEKAQGADLLKPRLQTKLLADIEETDYPDLIFPIDGLICEGATVLAGGSKIGKSWLALQMCMAIAAGEPCLDRKTQKGKVLYLALEDSERRLKSRAKHIRFKTGIRKDQYRNNLEMLTKAPTVKDGLIDLLDTWLQDNKDARMICIDVMQKVRGITPGNRNAYQDDYAYLTTFQELSQKHRVSILLLHHVNRRDDKSIGDPFDRISGSNGIMGTVDTAIILTKKRGQNNATAKIEGRDINSDDLVLNFEDGFWTLVSESAVQHDAKKAYEENPMVRLIKDIFEGNPNGVYISTVDIMKESLERYGQYITQTPTETGTAIRKVAEELLLYDDIVIEARRTSGQRGYSITRRLKMLGE